MRIALAIATTGRPNIVADVLARLSRQTRAPDRVIVVGAAPDDLPAEPTPGVECAVAAKGSCSQRNHALDMLEGDVDVVVFTDDDYIPAKGFFAGIERVMREHPDIVAASGDLIDDGILVGGISIPEADKLIADYEAAPAPAESLRPETGTYGCNMAFRLAAAPHVRFDERLPLYGWQEDVDFSAQYGRVGRIVITNLFTGVHLGVTKGRSPGKRLGYSQIVNNFYLMKKGTMRPKHAISLATKNLLANLAHSFAPEPWIDRRGRLRGNLIGLWHVAIGRADPRRILEM
jgi:GT2 family glycosyltransferase